jgi:hypothetical protein
MHSFKYVNLNTIQSITKKKELFTKKKNIYKILYELNKTDRG